MLSVTSKAQFDERMVDYEYRSHSPFTSTTFNPKDEVRISIQQQESLTHPSESYLHINGTISGTDNKVNTKLGILNNGIAHLFDEIRYEIGGTVVDRVRNVGISSLVHALLTLTPSQEAGLEKAWYGYTQEAKSTSTSYSASVPLKYLMGFFEDYKKIIMNQKQELIILLSSSFDNSIHNESVAEGEKGGKIKITRLDWRVPHVKVADEYKLPLLNVMNEDRELQMPFRSRELYEYPTLPTTQKHSWTIKTSSQMEKPRYGILAFHTDRKSDTTKNSAVFDSCNIRDYKLYLNSQHYPYENLRGDRTLMYDMYSRFQYSYFNTAAQPLINMTTFTKHPIYVIDCSKQNDSLKVGPVDVRLEFEADGNFPAKTSAYCLIIHDSLVEYNPLTGLVNRIS